MKKLISVLIVLALLFPASASLAEGEDTAAALTSEPTPTPEASQISEAELIIDTQHVYPGMDKSYAQGYVPSVADGTAIVVLPLTVSGGICDTLSASLDLGSPSSAPFVFKNYVNAFALGTYTVAGGDVSCCLIRFDLALRPDRINGSYPVVVHASGKTRDGITVSGEFTLYVVIADGKSAMTETPQESTAISQPKLIVEGYECSPEPLEAGAQALLSVAIKNTSTSQTAKNIKLSFKDEEGDILPASTGSAYIERIKKGASVVCEFDIRVTESASARTHMLTVTMEYENSNATAYVSSDTIVLDVEQPIRLEYEQPTLPTKVTEGDNVSFSMNVMNLGKSTVYNVLLTFKIPGLNNGGSVLVGNLQSGEAKKATTNLLVSSKDGEYGDTSGTILLSYENEASELFEREIAVQTRIEKKIAIAPADIKKSEGTDEGALPWWAWGAAGAVIIGAAGLLVIKMTKSKRQRENDERSL